jgi:hypothetical protein
VGFPRLNEPRKGRDSGVGISEGSVWEALLSGIFRLDGVVKKQLLEVFTGGAKNHGAITRLPSRFAVYVPSCLKDQSPIDEDRYRVLVEISKGFLYDTLGGLTCYEAVGSWRDGSTLHHEKVLVMESYCQSKDLRNAAFSLRQFANALAIEFEQGAMACAVDGEMLWFNPAAEYRKNHKDSVLVPSKRKMGSVLWKYVLAPMRAANVRSVYGKIA